MEEKSRLAEEGCLIAILILCNIQENWYFDYFMFTNDPII